LYAYMRLVTGTYEEHSTITDLDAAGAGVGFHFVASDIKRPVDTKAPDNVFAQELAGLLGVVLSRAEEAVQDPEGFFFLTHAIHQIPRRCTCMHNTGFFF
jgi:hypothetical protein